jgi:carboxymethylenebutenolidase
MRVLATFASLCIAATIVAAPASAQRDSSGTAPFGKQRVTFKSGELTLVGYFFQPAGRGPFPLVVWNHGSEPNPGGSPQFDSVAAVFVPAGYAVFAPVRRGHGGSEGRYIQDEITAARVAGGMDAAQRTMIRLHETEQLDDQLAGQAHAKRLAGVDSTRMVVAGCSYGGIQTLLAAERGAGYKAAISISPAALSWQGNTILQERLVHAVAGVRMPFFLIQPPKDASLEPSRVLGAEFRRLGKTFTGKIYPAEGPEDQQVHCFGGAKGMHNWAKDAIAFLAGALK